jgi:uncharacterized protein (TIGR00369 family)
VVKVKDFLANHAGALGKSLGIEIVEFGGERVVARLSLGPQHLTEAGAVQCSVVMAAADIVGALGATVDLTEGYVTTTLESKSNFLQHGSGNLLWAEGSPIHLGRSTAVWRTQVWRGSDLAERECIAEVTQTQLNLPSDEKPRIVAATRSDAAAKSELDAGGDPQVVPLRDVRKGEILAGACAVIARKGFAQASVREIAEAAGMPIPTMYKYIRSKDDILELIYETFLSEFRKELGNALSRRFPPKQQLAVALRATMTTFDRHHNEVKLLFRETKSLGDAARRRVYAQDQKYIEQWRNILIDAGVDSRLGIDAELLANFVHRRMGPRGGATRTDSLRHGRCDRRRRIGRGTPPGSRGYPGDIRSCCC